ncbi:helix-turn-helix transcriptional regulator [Salimicrobium sp. PL1-032A]|uniref:helix-turn-helix domain-containing protein n=1 Tax=Salimicrobium sp. PL1-032A TaxID=3095364 RepID=UPI0032601C92
MSILNGKLLKHLRLLVGLNQRELALKINKSHSLIAKVENNRRTITTDIERKLFKFFQEQGISEKEITLLSNVIRNTKG